MIEDTNFNLPQEKLFRKINNILSLIFMGSLISQVKKITIKNIFYLL